MPTRLITPQDNGEVTEGSGGNWAIAAVGADKTKFTGAGVSVAILDSGIDRNHPAFAGMNIVPKDFTGEGDEDTRGHGTHCAGIVFGRDVGGARIGVARGITTAFSVKVLKKDGSGDTGMLIEGLQWAARRKVDIASMSLGLDFPGMVADRIRKGWPEELAISQGLVAYRANLRIFDALMNLLKTQGGLSTAPLIIAAAGNQSRRRERSDFRIGLSLPAAALDVISVGAVSREGDHYRIADFSNAWPVLCAPGVDIVSAWPGGTLRSSNGTSMAGPVVCGVAALWLEKLRKSGRRVDATGLAARLRSSATRSGLLDPFDPADYGEGMVAAPTDDAT
jgi:subtilisin family serine protease